MSRIPQFRIIIDDVRSGLDQLPDASIDLICTSPPYWGQRSYGVEGQLGHEPTSQQFVDTMVEIFGPQYCKRVLKPHGILFLNLGDSYNGGGQTNGNSGVGSRIGELESAKNAKREFGSLAKSDAAYKPRDLVNVPYRVYEGLRQAGYYWRSTIVWKKLNSMPESVAGVRWLRHRIKIESANQESIAKIVAEQGIPRHRQGIDHSDIKWQDCPGCDKCKPNGGYILAWGSGRPTASYELIAMLTQDRYYWDDEAVRTTYAESSVTRRKYGLGSFGPGDGSGARMSKQVDRGPIEGKYSGAKLRNVWELSTAQFKEKHYATFPESLPEICIKAGTSEYGNCATCGAPWARVLEQIGCEGIGTNSRTADVIGTSESSMLRGNGTPIYQTVGWKPTCDCGAGEVVNPMVLDPFAGAGTTLLVANRLGRDAIGIELNGDYAELARRRIIGDAPLLYLGEGTELPIGGE